MRTAFLTLGALTTLGLTAGAAQAGHPDKSPVELTLAAHFGGGDFDSIHEVRGRGHHGPHRGHPGHHRGHHPRYHHRPPWHHGPPSYHGYPRYGIPYRAYPPPVYRHHYYYHRYPHSGLHYRGPRVSFGFHF